MLGKTRLTRLRPISRLVASIYRRALLLSVVANKFTRADFLSLPTLSIHNVQRHDCNEWGWLGCLPIAQTDSSLQRQKRGILELIQLFLQLKQDTREREIAIIEAALEAAKYSQRDAANKLGLTYHQLRGYLKKYNLVGERSSEE